MSHKYIAIAGNIGVGKSSLVEFLCKTYGVKPFFEYNDENPYLKDFYQDMPKWAFQSQIHFLSHKFRIHQELAEAKETVIQDRSIYEDAEIFATNLHRQKIMNARDFATYYEMYQTILKSLPPPDVMIYLACPVKVLQERIKKRGRKMEQSIPSSYLRQLHTLYEEWINNYKLSPALTLSTAKMDYLTNWIDRMDVLEKIEGYL